jgi:hypothetical protein
MRDAGIFFFPDEDIKGHANVVHTVSSSDDIIPFSG